MLKKLRFKQLLRLSVHTVRPEQDTGGIEDTVGLNEHNLDIFLYFKLTK